MGSSSTGTDIKTNENIEIKVNEQNIEKIIYTGRKQTFQPINLTNSIGGKTQNKNLNNNFKNNNNCKMPFQNPINPNNFFHQPVKREMSKANSAPIQYKDNNLILTNYFDKIIDKEKEELDRIYYKYTHTFYNFNNNNQISKEQQNLRNIREKIDSDFGLMKLMQKDFKKMKTCLLYCSNLSVDDEKVINKLEFDDLKGNNAYYKQSIINIINKNKKQIPELISNLQ